MPSSPDAATIERALAVLTSDELDPIVEMVVRSPEPDVYEAVAPDGRCRFRRSTDGTGWRFDVVEVNGRDPLADQAVDRFDSVAAELANPQPHRTVNSYPHAFEMVAQLFDHPAAPDLCVIHSAAHHWGHLGEHGSIGVIQARAPFVAAGIGVHHDGLVDRHCRLVDIAPTMLAILGATPAGGIDANGNHRDDAHLARQCGDVVDGIVDDDAERPANLVGLLFDGANPNVLYESALAGDLPNVRWLLDQGTAFRHGAISALPTVTLANHTSILTGCYPGHHGILHNAWYDRRTGQQKVANSPATWATAMVDLFGGVETVHHAVQRAFPGATTASINEPADAGATWSTFGVLRAGGSIDRPPPIEHLPDTSHRFARPVKDYRWGSKVDHTTVRQFQALWSAAERSGDPPRFTWCNFTLTDSAFHEGGPHSEIAHASLVDTDARLGRIMETIEAEGRLERTAFVLTADHGMELNDPGVTGDWGHHLRAAGLTFRDEGFGFLYLGEEPDQG